jgi:subtilisin-like proprotein convertase family protein
MKLNSLLRKLFGGLCLAMLFVSLGFAQQPTDLYHYDEFGNKVQLQLTGNVIDGRPEIFFGTHQPMKGGVARNEIASPTTLTSQFVVMAKADSDVHALAQQWGVSVVGQLNWDRSYYILESNSPVNALQVANGAFERGEVAQVFSQFSQQKTTRQLPNDTQFSNQWHLRNTGQGGGMVGFDLNVEPLWNFNGNSGLGSGITVGIVDGRVQAAHSDLAFNIRADRSLWLAGTPDFHGTAVAGIVGAIGNNNLGVSGVAPRASLAGISLLNQTLTDAVEAQALTNHFSTMVGGQFDGIHIYNNSWGPSDNGTRVGAGPLVRAALANAAVNGRDGLGNIYVWAGGNGGNVDNVNYDGYANSRYTIAVGATTNLGVRASYSERGAALLVNAMGDGGTRAITSTSTGNGYTNSMGGTSSASPMVAGVVALMLEANPNLGWRDVQHILVQTAWQTDPGHAGWITNGAGLTHNDFYGFGTVDAVAAVNLASNWTNVQPEMLSSATASVNQIIADGSGNLNNPIFGAPVFSTIEITDQVLVEHVEVIFNTSGGWGGDLEVVLTSPMGTQSMLATLHGHGAAYNNWTFMTVKNWGELSQGTWTLRVRDGWATDQSTWLNWSLNVYGTTAIPEPSSIILLGLIGLARFMRRNRRPLS